VCGKRAETFQRDGKVGQRSSRNPKNLARLIKFIIGLLMLVSGIVGLLTYADPELPVRATFKLSSVGEPVDTLLRHWFEFSNGLQTMPGAEYIGYLVLFFMLTVSGALTLWKVSRGT
jgi:hypothetical protein